MKLFVNRYYPVFINVYTIWVLYLLFFASFRYSPTLLFEIKTTPFETINEYSTKVITFNKIEAFENIVGNIVFIYSIWILGIFIKTKSIQMVVSNIFYHD